MRRCSGEVGVGRDLSRGCEMEIALDGKSQRSTGGGELREAHIAEFGFAEAEVAKPKS
jgi:hypothetical protein